MTFLARDPKKRDWASRYDNTAQGKTRRVDERTEARIPSAQIPGWIHSSNLWHLRLLLVFWNGRETMRL
jgi:hypothetical protein